MIVILQFFKSFVGDPMATQTYFPFNFPSSAAAPTSNSLWLLSSTAIENFVSIF